MSLQQVASSNQVGVTITYTFEPLPSSEGLFNWIVPEQAVAAPAPISELAPRVAVQSASSAYRVPAGVTLPTEEEMDAIQDELTEMGNAAPLTPVSEIEQLHRDFQAIQQAIRAKPPIEKARALVEQGKGIKASWQEKILAYRENGEAETIAKLEEAYETTTKNKLPAKTVVEAPAPIESPKAAVAQERPRSAVAWDVLKPVLPPPAPIVPSFPALDSAPVAALSDPKLDALMQRAEQIKAMKARLAAKTSVASKPVSVAEPAAPQPAYPAFDAAPLQSLADPKLQKVIERPAELDKALDKKAQADFERALRKAEGKSTLMDKLREKFKI